MKLPFMIVRRSTWQRKHEYRLFLENDNERLAAELITAKEALESKTRVLTAVETAVPILKDQAVRQGVEAGKTYMKRELIRHVRSKSQK